MDIALSHVLILRLPAPGSAPDLALWAECGELWVQMIHAGPSQQEPPLEKLKDSLSQQSSWCLQNRKLVKPTAEMLSLDVM